MIGINDKNGKLKNLQVWKCACDGHKAANSDHQMKLPTEGYPLMQYNFEHWGNDCIFKKSPTFLG